VKTTTTTKSPTHHKYYIVDEIEIPSDDASNAKILADLSTVICTDSKPEWDDCKVKSTATKRDPVKFSFQTDVTTIYDKSTTKTQYNSKFESADETQLEVFDENIKDHRFTGEICEMIDGSDDCKEIIEDDLNVGLIVGMTFFGLFIVLVIAYIIIAWFFKDKNWFWLCQICGFCKPEVPQKPKSTYPGSPNAPNIYDPAPILPAEPPTPQAYPEPIHRNPPTFVATVSGNLTEHKEWLEDQEALEPSVYPVRPSPGYHLERSLDQSGPSSQVRLEPIKPKYPPPNPNLKPKKRAAPPKKRARPPSQKTAVAVLPPISAADSANVNPAFVNPDSSFSSS